MFALQPGLTHLNNTVEGRVLEPRFVSSLSQERTPVSKKASPESAAHMHADPVKEFIKGLNKLDRSFSPGEMFRDMMEMGYCAWAKLMAPTPERAEELEARYMQIVGRYPNKDTVRAFKPLLDIAQTAVEGGGIDFLGQVSGELEVLNPGAGQFFTPYEVSKLLAQINLFDVGQIIAEQGYITVSEPAAGSGGIVLAVADELTRLGFQPWFHMLVEAVDVSALAFYMCYLQLTWRGVPAGVIRGNSLSLETFESAWTIHAHWFKMRHGHLFDRPEYDLRTEQLSLFADLQDWVGFTR